MIQITQDKDHQKQAWQVQRENLLLVVHLREQAAQWKDHPQKLEDHLLRQDNEHS